VIPFSIVNAMKCVPFWKGCNRDVDYIDRSHRGLHHVPFDLDRYARCLEELLLDGNLITSLPRVHVKLMTLFAFRTSRSLIVIGNLI